MIGLIGRGYWGKILEKNTKFDLVYDVAYPEISTSSLSELLEKCDHVFVATPFDTHYDIVKQALLKGCHVFCEKPLCRTMKQVDELYDLANKKHLKLHVDWLFAYNRFITTIKELDLGKLKSLKITRLNKELVRSDARVVWDLMSHDLSVIFLFANNEFQSINIEEYDQHTAFGYLEYFDPISKEDFYVHIHDAGNYPKKETNFKFQFEKGFVEFDDVGKKLYINEIEQTVFFKSPLKTSIDFFMNMDIELINNNSYDITKYITSIIERH